MGGDASVEYGDVWARPALAIEWEEGRKEGMKEGEQSSSSRRACKRLIGCMPTQRPDAERPTYSPNWLE